MNNFENPQSGNENKEEINSQLIQQAENFDDLNDKLRQIGTIAGSGQSYTAESLIESIQGYRDELLPLHFITRRYGLRDKVESLKTAE